MASLPVEYATRFIRRRMAGPGQDFTLRAAQASFEPPYTTQSDLYLHIPFCENNCPYCPYNKIPYDPNLKEPYAAALLAEMEIYRRQCGLIKVGSVYIGGGTPTTMADKLPVITEAIRRNFQVEGSVCMEAGPEGLQDGMVGKLLECGIDQLSIGGQSFDDRFLNFLGRSYDSKTLLKSLETIVNASFQSVNLDLMFALPGQTLADVDSDLTKALASGVDQVTVYPLFSFPYTAAGEHLKIKNVRMPPLIARRKMYRHIHRYCLEQGLERVSVWSFMRRGASRYSSVTRDCYIGLGAGSASHLKNLFYLNTFSVPEYMRSCRTGHLPVALKLDFTAEMERAYWLYWRLYDTNIPIDENYDMFSGRWRLIFRLIQALGLGERIEGRLSLTEKGAFWLHLLQNYFALNYINKIWSNARKEPWPCRISV